ncbi:MAG: Mur ligase family protein, partial [Pseudomonadota bacterium]
SDSLPLELAMFLNFAPDHLDYHRSEAAYFSAKQRIFKGASQYLCNREDERSWPLGVQDPATVISFGFDQPRGLGTGLELDLDGRELIIARARDGLELRLPASGFPLAGRHNLANLLAALAALVALQPQPDLQRLRASVDGFAGLPHRCERVGASGGVEFINDSKATNVAATVAAIEGLAPEVDGRVLLLVGGDAKDAELAALRAAVADRVALVICYGADGPRFAAALADTAAVQPVDTAAAAFAAAVAEARSGDLVLLAPAAASFDEFANFAARGDWFREQVARHVGRQEAQPC